MIRAGQTYPLFFRGLILAMFTCTFMAHSTVFAEESLSFSSSTRQATVLELYTSEGCSSCPPADNWLGELVDHPGLWTELVPLAFHVDYWNYLGWPDTLGKPAFGKRQREYRSRGATGAVYTPGFVANGREWRGWFTSEPLLPASQTEVGVLKAEVRGQELCVRFEPNPETGNRFSFETALLGFDITNNIGRGENRGRQLTHQFAVLEHTQSSTSENTWCQSLVTSGWPTDKLAIAVWVTRPGDPTPLQATGSWITKP